MLAEDRPPKPCFLSLKRQTEERVALYTKIPSPGEPIPINIMPVMVNDAVPGELEIRTAARRLCNRRAGGISGIRAEDI